MKNPLLQNKKAISDSLAVEQSKAIETYGISTEIKLYSDRFDEIAPKPNRAEIKLVHLADNVKIASMEIGSNTREIAVAAQWTAVNMLQTLMQNKSPEDLTAENLKLMTMAKMTGQSGHTPFDPSA